jgi:pyridoxal phosphate enzyme (YggS family)
MPVKIREYEAILQEVSSYGAQLVAVSKTKPSQDILELFNHGQRDFGENYVQELTEKQALLSDEIRWHFIGHLQSNKAKYIVPFVHLIHGIDSLSAITEINKQAIRNQVVCKVLVQVRIAREETKSGVLPEALDGFLDAVAKQELPGVRVCGLMGMATNTDDTSVVSSEFRALRKQFVSSAALFRDTPSINLETLSMGMTSDYKIALEEGSTMVRIGSAIFGER